jgi:hypothetical protein
MHTAPTHPAPAGTQQDRQDRQDPQDRQDRQGRQRRCWPLAVSGLALLVASVVMMAAGAQSSRAQTARPHLAPSRLAPLRLPAPAGRYQVSAVSLHLIDRSRPNPWVASPPYRELMISVFYPARDATLYPADTRYPAAGRHSAAVRDPGGARYLGSARYPVTCQAGRAGLTHLSCGKRAKSESAEHTPTPWPRARAAR